ncbi:hypothetical protein VNO78_04133 [Psophocarpus tetragonolobus]|uniref:RING-type E3 ubiquitin transferase n=1 Tax=Psophocarpus tetragonolobus TaxID=3891 RepID=A0AAN9T1K7_PSOTE
MMFGGAALWPVLFLTIVSIGVLITMDNASTGIFIFFGCIVGLFLWHCIGLVLFKRERTETGGDRTVQTTRIVIARVRAEREPWQDVQLFSFAPRAHVARLAIRALPPVTCFRPDHSQPDCPICIEHFKIGDFIQSFGVCLHHFHSSCINTWLLAGNITCPVCRKELSITLY